MTPQSLLRSGRDGCPTARQPLYLLALAVLLMVFVDGELWASRWHADDDSRQHVFWTYRYRDPEVLVNDFFADAFAALAPWGYRALFRATAPLVDPLLFSKALALALLGITIVFAWRLGRRLEPRAGGLVAGLLALSSIGEFQGGLPRTFAFPLMVVHLDALVARRYGIGAAVLVAEALFYPQALLVGAGIHGLTLLRDLVARPGSLATRLAGARRPLALSAGGLALAGAAVAGPYLVERPPGLGPIITRAEARHRPEFQEHGRVEFFRDSAFTYWVTGGRSGIVGGDGRELRAVLIVALALVLGRRLLRTPAIVLDTAAVGLVLFALAHALLFRLHLPNRYTRTTLALAGIMLLAIHARAGWCAMQQRLPWTGRPSAWLAARGTAAAAAVFVLVAAAAGVKLWGEPRRVTPGSIELFQFARTLPKQAMLAGNTGLAWIPLLAQRRVFVDREYALPYLKGYYAEVTRRQAALRRALDTGDAGELNRFCGDSGVTHLVLRKSGAPALPPAARNRPPAERVFENERYLVVACARGAQA